MGFFPIEIGIKFERFGSDHALKGRASGTEAAEQLDLTRCQFVLNELSGEVAGILTGRLLPDLQAQHRFTQSR